jgi:hypothetical protein
VCPPIIDELQELVSIELNSATLKDLYVELNVKILDDVIPVPVPNPTSVLFSMVEPPPEMLVASLYFTTLVDVSQTSKLSTALSFEAVEIFNSELMDISPPSNSIY